MPVERVAWLAAGLLGLSLAFGASADDDFEDRLQRAESLNLTAPWEESQAILDDLSDELEQASPLQRVRYIFLEARNLALAGNYREAVERLGPVFEEDLDPELKLKVHRLAGNIELQRDRFEEAYRHLLMGLELLPDVEAARPKVNLLASVAYFYGSAGEGEQAIQYGQRAVQIAESGGDMRDICVARHDLSVGQERAGHIADALATRTRALEACREAQDPIHTGVSITSIGQLRFEQTGDPAAVDQIRTGIEKLREAGYRDGVLNSELALAEVLLELGAVSEAENLLEPLVGEFERFGLWRSLQESHALLATIAERQGDYRRALEHFKASESAGERLLDRERAMRVAYLQVELDTRQKEQQIELLREQNRVLELRDETQRQRRYIAFGGVIATSIIGLLLLLLLMRTRSDRRYLLWLSQHDGLTGLRNHTSFFRRANDALDVSRQSGQPFSLVVADIDYFKEINDRYGHIAGDTVLSDVGRQLRSVFDAHGIVGRIGGEEFAMALPGIERDRARELIQEFNGRLNPVKENGSEVDITLSYGVVETQDDTTVERMRFYADQALYEAKRRGRNQVVDAAEISDDPAIQMRRRADDPR